MTIHEFEQALEEVSSGVSRLSESKEAAATGKASSAMPAELIKRFGSLNKQLQSLAPHMAQVFCCKAAMVKFIKTLVESAEHEPEIRDGGFYFDLFIDQDEMTWDEYFGVEEHEKGIQ